MMESLTDQISKSDVIPIVIEKEKSHVVLEDITFMKVIGMLKPEAN